MGVPGVLERKSLATNSYHVKDQNLVFLQKTFHETSRWSIHLDWIREKYVSWHLQGQSYPVSCQTPTTDVGSRVYDFRNRTRSLICIALNYIPRYTDDGVHCNLINTRPLTPHSIKEKLCCKEHT